MTKQAQLRKILTEFAYCWADHTFLGVVKVTSYTEGEKHAVVVDENERTLPAEVEKLSNFITPTDHDRAFDALERFAKMELGMGKGPPSIPGNRATVLNGIRELIADTRRPR